MKRLLAGLAVVGRAAAGGMLVFSGFLKLRAPVEEFAAALEAYRLFPDALVFPMAHVLPWVEYLLGIFLITGLWLRWAAPAALALFGAFVTVLGAALARGAGLASCGCFGGAWPLSPAATLSADSFVLLLLVASVADREKTLSVDRFFDLKPGPRGVKGTSKPK